MSAPEVALWIGYAEENLAAAILLLDSGHLNPCLQEAQQAAEKAMKAIVMSAGLEWKKTHSIRELKAMLDAANIPVGISSEDGRLMDSIYLPSKYPLGSSLPDCEPDKEVCRRCIEIAGKAVDAARQDQNKTEQK